MKIPGIGRELTTIIKKSKDLIKQLFVPGMYFEDMGITYVGPIDGHNIPLMVDTLNHHSCCNKERKRLSPCGTKSSEISWNQPVFPKDRRST